MNAITLDAGLKDWRFISMPHGAQAFGIVDF
jgi:hypothetical protein